MEIHLNMYQTLAVAVLVLLFGSFLRPVSYTHLTLPTKA